MQLTLEQFSHPYDGRVLRIRPYGSSIPCWITEEHRVWAIPGVELSEASKKARRRCAGPDDIDDREPEWVRAWDLRVGDVVCYPRLKRQGATGCVVELDDGRRLSGNGFWRFLGYWVGDGGAPTGSRGAYPIKLHLSEAKSYFIADAQALLARFSTGSVSSNQWPSRGRAIDVRSSSDKSFWTELRNSVGIGTERRVPYEWISRASDDELRNFLIGYFRTDGTKGFRKDGVLSYGCITTTAQGLACNVLYALNRLGLAHSVNERESRRYGKENQNRWDIQLSVQALVELLPPEDLEGVELPQRQQQSKVWFDDEWVYSVVKEIEEDHYEGDVYDLKMDGDPSFGTPACLMLHNCTDRPGADEDLMRAMQGALSESEHSIFLLSTFHLPVGFFADVWDNADTLGFTKVVWNCFETMTKCEVGMEKATADDPLAVEAFCKKDCPLSWERPTYNEFGQITGSEWVGCLGTARNSDGWQSRETVLEEQRINVGTRIFEVEHCCIRPEREGQIYNRSLIDACVVPSFNLRMDRRKVIGIDWGLTQCAVVLLGEWTEDNPEDPKFPIEGIGVIDVVYMSNRLTDTVIEQIKRWQLRYGDRVVIRADGSHPYCNRELAQAGYRVKPVHGDRKLLGEDNLARWIGSGKLRILDGFALFVTQLHNLRRNVLTGKQVKKNLEGDEGNHGPDAWKFAMMEYDFIRWYRKRRQDLEEHQLAQQQPRKPMLRSQRRGLDSLLYQ